MKLKKLSLFFLLGLAVCSCSSNDDFEDDNTDNASLTSSSNNYYEYVVGDTIHRIVYKTNNNCVQEPNENVTRSQKRRDLSIEGWVSTPLIVRFNPDGYAQGVPVHEFDKYKVLIKNHSQVPNGIYNLQFYKVSTKVEIPQGYRDIELDESGIVGYADWVDVCDNFQSVKISYTNRKPNVRELSFYTAVVTSNMIGQQMWEVLPMDGKKIKVPYRFVK